MPMFRYFIVVGFCLLCCVFAAGYFFPKIESARIQRDGSLEFWRQYQATLSGRNKAAAVIYPDAASMAPTVERLAWERQLTFKDAPAPSVPVATAYEARGVTVAEASSVRRVRKTVARPKLVARSEDRARITLTEDLIATTPTTERTISQACHV